MKEEKLTDNAIDKILGGINGTIVQLIAVNKKTKNRQQYYGYLCPNSDAKLVMDIVDSEAAS